uniref:Uncharacterized protein n=1 Tax=Cucumis melo TaxID=3656 RepID=A0A9I9ECT3_CUCME
MPSFQANSLKSSLSILIPQTHTNIRNGPSNLRNRTNYNNHLRKPYRTAKTPLNPSRLPLHLPSILFHITRGKAEMYTRQAASKWLKRLSFRSTAFHLTSEAPNLPNVSIFSSRCT